MNLIRNYRNWRVYRDTVNELGRLSNRQLHDLGIIRDEIKSQRARERNTLFETGVRDMLIKEGKIKINQDVINRLIGNYRSS